MPKAGRIKRVHTGYGYIGQSDLMEVPTQVLIDSLDRAPGVVIVAVSKRLLTTIEATRQPNMLHLRHVSNQTKYRQLNRGDRPSSKPIGFKVTKLAKELMALVLKPRLEELPGLQVRVGLGPSREVDDS